MSSNNLSLCLPFIAGVTSYNVKSDYVTNGLVSDMMLVSFQRLPSQRKSPNLNNDQYELTQSGPPLHILTY